MKKIKNIAYLMIVSLLSSCSFETNDLDLTGQPILFGATVERQMPQTKTEYSGSTNQTGERERIDWVPEKDKILIYMYSDNGNGQDTQTPIPSQEYVIKGETPQGYISVAPISASNPLTWRGNEFEHRFTGIYPSSYGGTYTDKGRWEDSFVTFKLPDVQDGSMDYAYMAAISRFYKAGEKATLQFYPMITTLYFTFNNDTGKEQEIKYLELKENSNYPPLVGSYEVAGRQGGQFYPRGYGFNNGSNKVTLQVNQPIAIGESISMPLFIIPQDRNASNMNVDIFLSNKKLSNSLSNRQVSTFESLKKYNISINLSGEGTEIDPEPEIPDLPPVKPGDLTAGGCQFIYAAIKPGLLEVFRALLGNDFINNKVDKLSTPVTKEAFYEMFTLDEIKTILEYLQTASNVSIEYNSAITETITAEDFQTLIPCVKKLSIRVENDMEMYFEEMPLLSTLQIEGNGKIIIHAGGCDQLKTITWWDKQKQNGSGIWIQKKNDSGVWVDDTWHPASEY